MHGERRLSFKKLFYVFPLSLFIQMQYSNFHWDIRITGWFTRVFWVRTGRRHSFISIEQHLLIQDFVRTCFELPK